MRLAAIALLLVAGIFAGAQLGKVAPLVGWYQQAGFSLVLVGWLTSVIGIFVAICALPVGLGIQAIGARRSAVWGSIALSVGAFALPLVAAPEAILAARLVEAVGYVVLVIALPALLAAISLPHWRATVLAIWSCFVPVGYAVSDLSAQLLLPVFDPPVYLLAMAGGFAVCAGLGLLLAGGDAPVSGSAAMRAPLGGTLNRDVAITAIAFGLFVVQALGFFSFMPAYSAEGDRLLLSPGLIALTVPAGNILAGFLVRGLTTQGTARLSAIAFAVTALTAWPIFAGSSPLVATVCAIVFVIAGGVVGSALYAVLPALVGAAGSVSIAIGLVAQAGGLGTLFGPPLAGWVIQSFGWPGLGGMLAAIGLAAALLILPNTLRRQTA